VNAPSDEIRVALVEDQKPLRDGLAALIGGTPGYRVVGSFGSMEEALARIFWDRPDVALLDIELPGMSGIEGVRRLKTREPALQILMLTIYGDDEHVFEAICAGASGYLLKDTPPVKLLEAIHELRAGGAPMSPDVARRVVTMFQTVVPVRTNEPVLTGREMDVLRLLAAGHTYKTAAADLSISPETIRFHVRNIYEKLHVESRSEAVLKAFRSGLLR
jgi:DNA-binding NarL/FixJ family response regulator